MTIISSTEQTLYLDSDLYAYQVDDVNRICRDGNDGFTLLSGMGSGKTPIALGVSRKLQSKKTLVICPQTLQLEWVRQIGDWMGIEASVARKNTYDRLGPLFWLETRDNPFFIINYESFRSDRHLGILIGYPFELIIMDEAHKVRNNKTKQFKGLLKFVKEQKRARVLGLTGSPIVNDPTDLHSILCIVRPDQFTLKGRRRFIEDFTYFYVNRYGKLEVESVRDMERLKALTEPFTIRRTKEEVLPFLPEKYFRNSLLQMPDDQRDAYNQMESELFINLDNGEPLWAPSVLAALIRLRQLNLDPKILGLSTRSSKTEFIEETLEDNSSEKIVIFSGFETYISYLYKRLVKKGFNCVQITGKVSMEDRAAAVRAFQTDPKVTVALGTIGTMGEGITLTASNNVIMADRWWNPAANDQAVDRLHRIGQKNAVQVILPVNEKSIDQSLDNILRRKAKMSRSYLGDKDTIKEVIEDLRESRRSR